MGMRELNAEILAEARTVTGRPKLRQKDISEWRSGEGLAPHEGETVFHLPGLQVDVAVVNEKPKAAKGKGKKPTVQTCPKCGRPLGPDDQIIECPNCGCHGSTGCCNTGGVGCACVDCNDRENQEQGDR